MRRALALDLGTTTGWTAGTRASHISGIWNLKPGRFEGGGMRFVKFRKALNEIHAAYGVEIVFFEEVRRHAGTDAAHCYGGLLGILTEWCEANGIPYEGASVGEIKKSFTGRGNATKEDMINEARRREYSPIDDNEADSLALFLLKAEITDSKMEASADGRPDISVPGNGGAVARRSADGASR